MTEAVIKITGESDDAVRGYRKIIETMRKMNQEQKKTGQEGEKAGKKIGGAMTDAGQKGAQAGKKIGSSMTNAHQKTASSSRSAHGSMGGDIKRTIAGYVGVGVAIAGVRKIVGLWQEDMKKSADITRQVHEATLELQFMGDLMSDPNVRKKVLADAEKHGLDWQGVAAAKTSFRGAAASLDPEFAKGLWNESLEGGQIYRTSMGTKGWAEIMAKFGTLSQAKGEGYGPNQIQNIAKMMIDEAGFSAQEIAPHIAEVLSTAEMGGVSLTDMAGIYAGATQVAGGPEKAKTALKNIVARLMVFDPEKSSDEELKAAWKASGITKDDDAYQRMQKFADVYQEGKLSKEGLVKFVGLEAAGVAPLLFKGFGAVEKTVEKFRAETGPERDIVGEALIERARVDPTFRYQKGIKQTEAGIVKARLGLTGPQLWDQAGKSIELASLNAKEGSTGRWAKLAAFKTLGSVSGAVKQEDLTRADIIGLLESLKPSDLPPTEYGAIKSWEQSRKVMGEAIRDFKEKTKEPGPSGPIRSETELARDSAFKVRGRVVGEIMSELRSTGDLAKRRTEASGYVSRATDLIKEHGSAEAALSWLRDVTNSPAQSAEDEKKLTITLEKIIEVLNKLPENMAENTRKSLGIRAPQANTGVHTE